eukprot:8870299-Alexandrium_andersonii.AAC.1
MPKNSPSSSSLDGGTQQEEGPSKTPVRFYDMVRKTAFEMDLGADETVLDVLKVTVAPQCDQCVNSARWLLS